MAPLAPAGEIQVETRLPLPAAATKVMPLRYAASTALLTAVEVGPPPDTLTTDFSVRLLIIMSFSAQSIPSIRAEKDQFVAFEILTETRLHFFATPY